MDNRKWWENWYDPQAQYTPYEYAGGVLAGMTPKNLREHALRVGNLKRAGLPVHGKGGYHYSTGKDFGERSIYPPKVSGIMGFGSQLLQEMIRGGVRGIPTGLRDALWNYRGLLDVGKD